MRTPICDIFDIEYPIFGFSHCRDVVAAISRAGGMGVFGAALVTPEQLEMELKWIDENVNGKPYGVDVVIPKGYVKPEGESKEEAARRYKEMVPEKHWEFVDDVLEELEVPPLPETAEKPSLKPGWDPDVARQHIDVAFGHPMSFLVNALGPPPNDVVDQAHERGIPVGALAGKPKHAVRSVEEGVDVIITQGNEAGGHTGEIGTVVLIPDIVDAVGPDIPVLGAGGIASGRQIAAAMALGAQGAWMGSVWLTTAESDVEPGVKQRYLQAQADETMRTRENSGKPSRGLRTDWREAWQRDDAPEILSMPLQGIATAEAKERINHAKRYDLMHASVGEVVGRMNKERSVKDVVYEMINEYIETMERLRAIEDGDVSSV